VTAFTIRHPKVARRPPKLDAAPTPPSEIGYKPAVPAVYQIKFRPGGRVAEFFGSRGNYYDFDGGGRIDVRTRPVWCRACGKFTHGEEIEPLEEIDQEIARLTDRRAQTIREMATEAHPMVQDFGPPLSLESIGDLRQRRQWRAARTSPPRCIHCGTTDIVPLPLNRIVPNPGGPGTIEVQRVGFCSTNFNEWYFTAEGQRIPRDTKPTYWHWPTGRQDAADDEEPI
jgi:hypothetical protein